MRPVRTHRFRGRKYHIHLDHRLDGSTSVPGPDTPPWHLYVDCRLTGRAQLETIIHEATHAIDNDMPEQEVQLLGEELARFLWRLGYRRMEQED